MSVGADLLQQQNPHCNGIVVVVVVVVVVVAAAIIIIKTIMIK